MAESASSARRTSIVVAAAVALVTAICFAPSLPGGFVWDDWTLIARNAQMTDESRILEALTTPFWTISSYEHLGGPYSNLYRPIVKLAYYIQYRLFGEDPLGFHAVSLALHVFVALLALVWMRRRIDGPVAPSWVAAGLGAAVFALHPSRPETVAWISGSTDLWMLFFVLIGVLLLDDARRAEARRRGWFELGSFLALLLGAASKEAGALAVVLLATDSLLLRGKVEWRPVIVAAGASTIATAAHLYFVPPSWGEGVRGEGQSAAYLAVAALGYYMERLLLPWPPLTQITNPGFDASGNWLIEPWAFPVGAVAFVAFVALVAYSWRRRATRPYLADTLWFVVPLLPVLGLLARNLVAERFLYWPLLGIAALIARGLLRVLAIDKWRTVTVAVAGLVVALMGLGVVERSGEFIDDATLWRVENERNPENILVLEHVADASRADHPEEALRLYQRLYQIARARRVSNMQIRFALVGLELLLQTTSDADQTTILAIRDAYERFAREPVLSLHTPALDLHLELSEELAETARENTELFGTPRALAWLRSLEPGEAGRQVERLLEDNPLDAGLWLLLGPARARQGDWQGAERGIAEAMARLPNAPEILAMREQVRRAHAVSQQPASDPVGVALRDANVQLALGAPEAARRILDPQLALNPTDLQLVHARAQVDISDLRFDLAREVIEQARFQDPGDPRRWDVLLGRVDAAEREYGVSRARAGDG